MESTLLSSVIGTSDLEKNGTGEVMIEAIDRRARVFVHAKTGSGLHSFTGSFVGETRTDVVLELDNLEPGISEQLHSATLRVSFEVGATRYNFQSRCSHEPSGARSTVIHVLKPQNVTRAERRRSPRRRLREPAVVALSKLKTNPPWDRRATLLNVSADGLACGIAEGDAAALQIDDRLRVSFELGRPPVTFLLTARVIKMTKGGSSGSIILGLAFTASDNPEFDRQKLEKALVNTSPK